MKAIEISRNGHRLFTAGLENGIVTARLIVRITDITHLRSKLEFDNGKGVHPRPGRLAQSLQTPRFLTRQDLTLIEAAVNSVNG